MTLDQITVYVGLGVIVFGAVVWATKTSPGEENIIEVFEFKFRLNTPAIAVMAIGVVLVVVGGWLLPSKAPLSNSEPDHVPPAGQKPASAAEQTRQEQVEIDRLASAGFDENKLTTLARDAMTPDVRERAQRSLDVIATEKKSYEAVKGDIVALTEFLSKSCKACLVQGAARAQLIKLKQDQAAKEEMEILQSAGFDETKLTTLARDAKTPDVRERAQRTLDVIAMEKNKAQAPVNTKPVTLGDDHTELSIVPWHGAYAVHTASNRLQQFVFFYCREPAGQRLLAITLSHGSTPKLHNDGASLESIARTSAFEVGDGGG
jgi:hypothetical protein